MDPISVRDVINNLTDFILQYALALAAISILAMALLEAWKRLFKSREKYHMRILWEWVHSGTEKRRRPKGKPAKAERVYQQLIHLTTGISENETSIPETGNRRPLYSLFTRFRFNPENALFCLDLGRMMGQVQEAADTAMSNPKTYPDLYYLLTSGADPKDVDNWVTLSAKVAGGGSTAKEKEVLKKQTDTFSRLQQLVQRKLDGLQLIAGYTWKARNQRSAIILGAVLLFFSLSYVEWGSNMLDDIFNSRNIGDVVRILIASLVGGIAAPVAKDLVSALRRVRAGG